MEHAGEFAVQRRAGVRAVALGSARTRPEIPAVAAEFLGRQRMLLIGATGRDGLLWASALTGPEGFAEAVDERTVVIDAVPGEHDPLAGLNDGQVGMLAIEPMSRRRMRVNGTVRREGGRMVVRTEQAYANCPKYIQAREVVAEPTEPATPAPSGPADSPGPPRSSGATGAPGFLGSADFSSATTFDDGDRAWIEGADTFFVATSAPGLGADLSHRGGNPGFVRVVDDRRLVWPDYIGNSMYMTLGNLELDDGCGLLFLDWEGGDALHLTGRAHVDWDPGNIPGAQRLVRFEVDKIVRIRGASPLRWRLAEYSRHNPPV
ncbi:MULTISPECIES: pyridoxamine 5'-phosphate oxidase family protein [unclassified Streptosporangium]|uniref:pyridoxamine 5'-phosphate oxidase family protein n=1 Tax=unclassified Streptosporangium TaxID=2632669 RepID=UPI002E2C26DC|nr:MULTISPECIES: pyridoxamine 5'-phosphate oxidase family protein [unclassified Streptosporangium]